MPVNHFVTVLLRADATVGFSAGPPKPRFHRQTSELSDERKAHWFRSGAAAANLHELHWGSHTGHYSTARASKV